jgi:hypothetical protein
MLKLIINRLEKQKERKSEGILLALWDNGWRRKEGKARRVIEVLSWWNSIAFLPINPRKDPKNDTNDQKDFICPFNLWLKRTKQKIRKKLHRILKDLVYSGWLMMIMKRTRKDVNSHIIKMNTSPFNYEKKSKTTKHVNTRKNKIIFEIIMFLIHNRNMIVKSIILTFVQFRSFN